jgi:hypothetical protein
VIEAYVSKIIVVDQPFLDDLKQTSMADFQIFTSPDIDTKVITLPLASSEEIADLTQYMDASEIRPGRVLVKPGYSSQFVSVDSFSEDIVFRKYSLFVQLCIALGAKKIAISSIEDVSLETSKTKSTSAAGGVGAPLLKAEVGAKAGQSSLNDEVRKSIMKLNTEAHGGDPNLQEAHRIIENHCLQKDALFSDMYNLRRVSTNRLQSHEVTLDFSTDVKRIFDSSMQAKIKVMSKLYQGRVEFDSAKKSLERNRSATKLSVRVDF